MSARNRLSPRRPFAAKLPSSTVRLVALLVVAWLTFSSLSRAQPGLAYSGDVDWDPATGVVAFRSNGAMPDAQEGFYWEVPAAVRQIVIAAETTVTGGFRIQYREPSNPLVIRGENRKTSILFGTSEQAWTANRKIAEHDKWRYGSVNVVEDAVVHVSNLTSLNPRGYHFSGYANRAVLHVQGCNLLDTRPGQNNNSDGFAAAAGSSIRDSLISTGDDAVKIYHDVTIENVTIEQHRNGAPLQFGWGGKGDIATARVRRLTIRGVDPDGRYNMAPLTWEQGDGGRRDVHIQGLRVDVAGEMFHEDDATWRPIGLLELKPPTCTFHLTVEEAELDGLGVGVRQTRGRVMIDGRPFE